ncbi:MAG: ribose 5-phosphate isomerase B [Candidatus Omnitrophica bacterium]|nr:ribose 5-phosphate isomerase B [Candidatus Omnitrophota bacterium]
MSTLLIASDHAGFVLKEKLRKYFEQKGLEVKDLGAYSKDRCDYPEFAGKLAEKISAGEFKMGVLICKSGIGNSIVANRFTGVRAALCHNLKIAKLSRQHNDSNVLVLGSAFVKADLAKKMVLAWLKTDFLGGRHLRRVKLIKSIEQKIRRSAK